MEQICADLQAEHDALDAVVAHITEEQWDTDTPAEGWDVKDTIVHLVHADVAARIAVDEPDRFVELKNGLLTSGFESVFGSKEGKTGEEVLAWWRDERAQMLAAFATRAPKERIPWFGPDMSALSFGGRLRHKSSQRSHSLVRAGHERAVVCHRPAHGDMVSRPRRRRHGRCAMALD
jgi:uncharacterized protein (TIGR03084 family)